MEGLSNYFDPNANPEGRIVNERWITLPDRETFAEILATIPCKPNIVQELFPKILEEGADKEITGPGLVLMLRPATARTPSCHLSSNDLFRFVDALIQDEEVKKDAYEYINKVDEKVDKARYEKTYGIEQRIVIAKEITLRSPEGTEPVELKVRTEGALIKKLFVGETWVLTSSDTTDPATGQDIFQPVKTDATITMLPVGGNVGPQHGVSRYLNYSVWQWQSGSESLKLRGEDTLRDLVHLKTFTVEPDGLAITDDVLNTGTETAGLSIGEHYYFVVPEPHLAAMKFLDETGAEQSITARQQDGTDQTGPLSTFLPEFGAGQAIYFEGFTGTQIIEIPGIGQISLEAVASAEGKEIPVGLLIWHRPGSNTICFEPVAGFSKDTEGNAKNDHIPLKPGESLKLISRVRLKKK